ncbi:hypothetical protein FSP39_021634 [Pinctada imbricata]|uniref:TNFR-Cys domain-containing protein n=1 Tax=Pinctada imbricata TaxID=66713 RepID=A0AA88YGW2_PINIB|nr:hypothetical protein FSP39_021634 [Pinctada imbricata]
MPCESGYYSNTPNQAIGCSLCYHPPKCSRPNIEMTQNCNLTTNFDCRCKDRFYFKLRPGSNGDGDCKKHSSCPQGMYMERKGKT